MGAFQVNRNKNKSGGNIYTREKKQRKDAPKSKSERLNEGVLAWTSFYRANPHRFIRDYFGLELKLFQVILIYMMFHSNIVYFIASRGLGKSYLTAVYCITRSVLYPRTKTAIISATRNQAKMIVTEKIQKELMLYPNVAREIKDIKTSGGNTDVFFHNGSTITVVPNNDNARGIRANLLIADEAILLKAENYEKIFRPFLNVSRMPGFKNKPEYKDYPVEPNVEVILTSAHYKSNWVYEKWKSSANQMFKGNEDYFAVNLGYELSMEEGLLPEKFIKQVMAEDDFDPIGFSMEYEAMFYGSSEKAYFKLEDLQKCRVTKKPFVIFDEGTLSSGNKTKLNKFKIPKMTGERRILSADIAVSGGDANDNSIFTMTRLIPDGEEYKRQVVNIISMNGGTGASQALTIKRLFYDFEADYVALDCLGVGIAVHDELIKVTRDDERDIEYEPWKVYNDDALADRAPSNALPIIFAIKGNLELNHEIAIKMRTAIENGKIELLINDIEGRDYMEDKFDFDSKSSSTDMQARMLAPFLQTSALINEMVNLEYDLLNGKIRLKERGKMRKDRYSSLAYGNLLASKLEEELKDTESDYDFGLFFN